MPDALQGISSMATRQLLAELAQAHAAASGQAVHIESVGGVDAARRVREGECFDFVVLASEAIDALIADGHLLPETRVDVARSGMAVCVGLAGPRFDVDTEGAFKAAMLAARSVGYSTGPSGTALLRLFAQWGLQDTMQGKLIQARPGMPVGAMVAAGHVEVGVQQLSELIHVPGIDILGPLPAALQVTTVFSAAQCTTSSRSAAVRALLAWIAAPETADAKRRQGMAPA